MINFIGKYYSYDEIPFNYQNLNNDKWIQRQINKLYCINYKLAKKENKILLNSIIKRDNINILDFGGALGISYLLLRKIYKNKNIKYEIIETENICNYGNIFYSNDNNITFNTEINLRKVDIVYTRTSIQYIKNWKFVLSKLLLKRPKNFIFINLTAGDIETFLTLQKWEDKLIPYWFFNISEIVKLFKNSGYYLKKEKKAVKINSKYFNKKDRIKYTKNLIFEK